MIKIITFKPGENELSASLKNHVATLDHSLPYAKMMDHRINGFAKDACTDNYYIAEENGQMLSRLWNGWGKHDNAIGNFGNFYTVETARGKGIGGNLLSAWYDDILSRRDRPLALFCTAGSTQLVKLYSRFGFRLALKNTECGPLFMPLGNSPQSFDDFCDYYYTDNFDIFFTCRCWLPA